MASPFVGMDPYSEVREMWSDFHGDLTAVVSIHKRGAYARLIEDHQVSPLPPFFTQDKSWLHAGLQAAGGRP